MDYRNEDFKKVIERINYLYHKSQNEGLTEEEKEEQQELRAYYVEVIKNNFKVQLNKVEKKSKPKRFN